MNMKKILKTIKNNDTFLVSSHVNPDPDALCSELALAIYLRSIGKKVHIINNEAVPGRYRFLPGTNKIKVYKKKTKVKYDVAIIVDCGDLDRIGRVAEYIDPNKPLINIDHHITNTKFGSLNLVDPKASSTAEVLYELLTKGKCVFTDSLALHLYAGIMTDTGSFRFENTTPRTFEIAGELIKYKFSAYTLYRNLYEMIPLSDMTAYTKVISNFDTLYNGRVLVVELRKNILAKFSEEFDLRDTIFKFLRSIQGVEVYVILTEISSKETRVNLRSSSRINVAQIAGHFNGGGHKRASGCSVDQGIKAARNLLLKEIKDRL